MFEESYGQPSTVALNAASRTYHVTNDLLTPRGLMVVGTADSVDAFTADQAKMHLKTLSLSETKAIVPILNTDVITRAAWDTDARDLDTDRIIKGYAKTIRSNGGKVHTDAAATAIKRTATG